MAANTTCGAGQELTAVLWDYDESSGHCHVTNLRYAAELAVVENDGRPPRTTDLLALDPSRAVAQLDRALADDPSFLSALQDCRRLAQHLEPTWEGFRSALEQAIYRGEVLLFRIRPELLGPLPPLPGTETGTGAGTETGPRPVTDTWFELRVIDEMGVPIPGVELHFAFDRQTRVTDGDGRIRIDGVSARFHQTQVRTPPAAARPEPGELDSLRAAVKPRWDEVRPGPRYEPQGDDLVVPLRADAPIDLSLLSEQPRTIVVVPWVLRVRLIGGYFDTNKCFLLPSAVELDAAGESDMRKVRRHIAENPDSALLVVGHTDTTGEAEYNDQLSLERAEAVAAYLRHDVDAWLEWYEDGKPEEKRWRAHEDRLMIAALPALEEREPGESAGRRRLVAEYMALCGAPLVARPSVAIRGAGESLPAEDLESAPAGECRQGQRRVELYLYDAALGIQPPAPGGLLAPGCAEFREWVHRVRQTLDLWAPEPEEDELWVRFELAPELAAVRADELRLTCQAREAIATRRLGADHVPNQSTVDVRFFPVPAGLPLSLEVVPTCGEAYYLFEARTLAELGQFLPTCGAPSANAPLSDDACSQCGTDRPAAGSTEEVGGSSPGGEFEQGAGLAGPARPGVTVHAVLPTLLLRRLAFANPPAMQLYESSDAHALVRESIGGLARGAYLQLPDWEGRTRRNQPVLLLAGRKPSVYATFYWAPRTAISGTIVVTGRLTGSHDPYGHVYGRWEVPLDVPGGKEYQLVLVEVGVATPTVVGQFGLELDWEVHADPGSSFHFAVEGQAGRTTTHAAYVGYDGPLDPTRDEPVRDDQDTRTATPRRLDRLMPLLGPTRWRPCATGRDLEELIWTVHTELHRTANPPYFAAGQDIHLRYGNERLSLEDQWLMWAASARRWNAASCIGHVQLLKTMLAPLGIHIRRRLVLPVTTERPPEQPGDPPRPVSSTEVAASIEGRVLEGEYQRTDIRNHMGAWLRAPDVNRALWAQVALMSGGGRGDLFEGCALTPAGKYLPAAIPTALVLAQAQPAYRAQWGFSSPLEVLRFWASMTTASGRRRFMCWAAVDDGTLQHCWDRDGKHYRPAESDLIRDTGRELPIP